jgi:hypothetical protein
MWTMQGPHTLLYFFCFFFFLFFLTVHLLHEVGGEDAAGAPTGRPPRRSPPPRCSLTSWCSGVPGSLQSMSSASSRRAPPLRRLLLRHRRNTIGELRRRPSPRFLCPIAVDDPLVREVHGGRRRAGSSGGARSPQHVHPKPAPLPRFIESIPAAGAPSPAAAIHQILPARLARGATAWGRVEAMGVEEESRQVGGALPRRRKPPFLAGGGGAQARLRAAAAVDSGWWPEEEERPCPVSLFLL